MANKRHNRKTRRQWRMALTFGGGKPIHKSPKGRTGSAHFKMQKSSKRDGRITRWICVAGRYISALP